MISLRGRPADVKIGGGCPPTSCALGAVSPGVSLHSHYGIRDRSAGASQSGRWHVPLKPRRPGLEVRRAALETEAINGSERRSESSKVAPRGGQRMAPAHIIRAGTSCALISQVTWGAEEPVAQVLERADVVTPRAATVGGLAGAIHDVRSWPTGPRALARWLARCQRERREASEGPGTGQRDRRLPLQQHKRTGEVSRAEVNHTSIGCRDGERRTGGDRDDRNNRGGRRCRSTAAC
jgi:hypothetical protein